MASIDAQIYLLEQQFFELTKSKVTKLTSWQKWRWQERSTPFGNWLISLCIDVYWTDCNLSKKPSNYKRLSTCIQIPADVGNYPFLVDFEFLICFLLFFTKRPATTRIKAFAVLLIMMSNLRGNMLMLDKFMNPLVPCCFVRIDEFRFYVFLAYCMVY